ncbi:DUF1449 family protein [Synechocystis sp. PCC 7339]|uniref:OB-fold-containig protein n=1 Tax=unclassified Synechocystis TaxID=2640012 RepID=UPI001BF1681C|nr:MULTISPECIES: OB-fold-containig protein [unclassified Synechocystis]QUS59337.1 DUF1449 family protein [Synechocystis sp. PCC 7338]UAJ71523.1 DUF1449 family protein [Synechocystis sp. PCC 7339]
MLFHLANLPYWLLLAVGVLCLGLMIISGDGNEDLDLEVEMALDAVPDVEITHLDVELDQGGAIEEGEAVPMALQVLSFFGLGKVPLMILLGIDFSLWGVIGWILNVAVGTVTGTIPSQLLGWAGIIFLISLAISLWLGRLASRPIANLFKTFSQDVSAERVIGCTGTVTSKKLPYLANGTIGQAHVYDNAGNLLTLSVSLPDWATVIPHHNQEILIIDQSPKGYGYLAIAKDSSDQDKWLKS